MKNCFVKGPISPEFIANSIAHHQVKTTIGAHQIFLGQVRSDDFENEKVKTIDYTAHEDLANKVFHAIREQAFEKYDLTCLHIYHSIGKVNAGEICLFVFVSSAHRKAVQEAIVYLVEEIKKEVPIFGKEILTDDTHNWKVNTNG